MQVGSGANAWKYQVEGERPPLLDRKAAFIGAGVIGTAAGIWGAVANRGAQPLVAGLGLGACAAVLAGSAAYLLSTPRQGTVENPAFDAAELLERDRAALTGTRIMGSQDIVDEHGLQTGLDHVKDVKGVYRSAEEAHAAVERMNESSDERHAVAWIRDPQSHGDHSSDGWYSTGINYTEGTDDVYEYVAVSLADRPGATDPITVDVEYVPEGELDY